MLNEAQIADLHAYSLKRQTILSEQNRINYRLSLAFKEFHERWKDVVVRAAILKYNLVELDANFLAKYPVPEPVPAPAIAPPSKPKHVPVPKPLPVPESEPVPNQEINLEPVPTLSYWETYPPAPAPPLPATMPAFVPASMSVSFSADTSRLKHTDTDWIVTPEHFVMYCKIHPQLVTAFNKAALKKAELCKNIKGVKSSVVLFFRHFVLPDVGFDTTHYVKACLAHVFVIQYPEHAGLFDVVHYVARAGKKLGRQLDVFWKAEGLPVYK